MKSKLIKAEKWKTFFVCCPYIIFRREGLKPDIPTDDCSLRKKYAWPVTHLYLEHTIPPLQEFRSRTCGYKCLKTYSYPFYLLDRIKEVSGSQTLQGNIIFFLLKQELYICLYILNQQNNNQNCEENHMVKYRSNRYYI